MGKTGGHIKLAAIGVGQLHGDMLAVGGRSFADVHRHVQDASLGDADEFFLRARRALEMQAPHRALFPREGMIVLDKDRGNPGFRERAGIVGFAEEASRIFKPPRLNEQGAGNGKTLDTDHGQPASARACAFAPKPRRSLEVPFSRIGCHHQRFSRYQATVLRIPCSAVVSGVQPSSRSILEASIA